MTDGDSRAEAEVAESGSGEREAEARRLAHVRMRGKVVAELLRVPRRPDADAAAHGERVRSHLAERLAALTDAEEDDARFAVLHLAQRTNNRRPWPERADEHPEEVQLALNAAFDHVYAFVAPS